MRAQFKLPSIENEDYEAKPPIEVKFEIPYFTTSGIQVSRVLMMLVFFFSNTIVIFLHN